MRRLIAAVVLPLAATAAVLAVSSPASAASVSCTKKVNNTWGEVTCTTSGGAYKIKEVRFDCSAQSDKVYSNFTINGSWTQSHECTFSLTRILVTI